MSDRLSQHSPSWFRPKTFVFASIAIMTGYVLFHNERFLIRPSDPVWTHYAQVGWWLIPHGVAGACALLLAPLQFSERLRKRYTRAHRIVGRIYVAGAVILAPLGVAIQYMDEGLGMSRAFTVLTIVDAVILTTTTSVALLFAVRRRITLHRQWMTRSYAVALVFFEGRFITGVLGLDTAPESTQMTVIWSCLALALLLAEVANNYDEILTALRPLFAPRLVPRRQPQAPSEPQPAYSLKSPTP